MTAHHPLLRWRRDYGGPVVTVALAKRPPLRITPGHPVLTHAGWRRAGMLIPGVHVVVADTPDTDADGAYEDAKSSLGDYRLPTDAVDFRGDGDRHDSHVVCLDDSAWPPPRPWTGNEGTRPAVDPAVVTKVLDALCTPAEFVVATWTEACARVPGLSDAYPNGPVLRHGPLSADARRRLGSALAALPEMPLDRAALGGPLLGVPASLRLVEITAVDIGASMGTVHDVTTAGGCMVANGVVVAA